MKICSNRDGKTLTISVEGRIDSSNASELENALNAEVGYDNLILDFAALEYMSSAGLRVLLLGQKKMLKLGGKEKIVHVNEEVMNVLEMTGFCDILEIEGR